MYKLKSPSKIVANTTRRGKYPIKITATGLLLQFYLFAGITQNVDPFRDHSKNKFVDNNDNDLIK